MAESQEVLSFEATILKLMLSNNRSAPHICFLMEDLKEEVEQEGYLQVLLMTSYVDPHQLESSLLTTSIVAEMHEKCSERIIYNLSRQNSLKRSPSSMIEFKMHIDMIGIVGNNLWMLDEVTSKVVLHMNMSFNESGEYKKTFIGSGVGTGSMQVLQGVKFEVEPREDHAFEVEPLMNVSQGVGSQKV
ncbi:hypothetical protein Tco_0762504 [Tanacetum coccineum]